MQDHIPKVVVNDILDVLVKAQKAISNNSTIELKNLSDQTVHNASIFQDQDSVQIAVVVYAVSKLLERWGFGTEYSEELYNLLGSAREFMSAGDHENYKNKIRDLFDFISTVDKRFKIYVDKVIEKSQIKKGSRLYEHGLSMARAAEVLGVGQWELMSYVGKTRIADEDDQIKGVMDRLELARRIFP